MYVIGSWLNHYIRVLFEGYSYLLNFILATSKQYYYERDGKNKIVNIKQSGRVRKYEGQLKNLWSTASIFFFGYSIDGVGKSQM